MHGFADEHHRAAARRSRRHAGRARPLVQDEFLRAGLPDSVDRARAAALRRRGGLRDSASLVDVLPTLDASWPAARSPTTRRRSTAGAWRRSSRATPGRDEVIGEYLAEGAIAPLVMIKRGRYKFVHSPVDPDQLYDLPEDPDELRILRRRRRTSARARVSRRGAPALGPSGLARGGDRQPAAPAPGLPRPAHRPLYALGLSACARRQPPVCAQRSGSRRPGSHGAISAVRHGGLGRLRQAPCNIPLAQTGG